MELADANRSVPSGRPRKLGINAIAQNPIQIIEPPASLHRFALLGARKAASPTSGIVAYASAKILTASGKYSGVSERAPKARGRNH